MGIVGGFTVHDIRPRGGNYDNKPVADYTNAQGETKIGFGLGGCPIERCKVEGRAATDYYEKHAGTLAQELRNIYSSEAVGWAREKGFPEEVSNVVTRSSSHV